MESKEKLFYIEKDNLILVNKFATKFTIPEYVKSIDEGTFYECKYLKELIIPKSVEIIHNYAFSNCINLKRLKILNTHCTINTLFEKTPYNDIYKKLLGVNFGISDIYINIYINENSYKKTGYDFIKIINSIYDDPTMIQKYINNGIFTLNDFKDLLDEEEYNGFINGVNYGI